MSAPARFVLPSVRSLIFFSIFFFSWLIEDLKKQKKQKRNEYIASLRCVGQRGRMVVLVVLGNDFFLSLSSSFVSSLPLGRSVAPDGCEARARVRQGVVLVFLLLLLKVDKDFCVLLLLFGNDVSSSATAGPIPVQRHHTHSTGPSFIPPEEEEEDAGTSTIPPPPPLLLPLTLWYIAWRLGHDGSFFSAVRSSSSSISKERKESRGCRYCRPIGPWWK